MRLFGKPDIEKMAARHDLDGLAGCLDDTDPLVGLQAAQALATLGDWRGRSFLVGCLRDDDEDLRGAAAEMLGELREARTIPALITALDDPIRSVRQAAAASLEAIGGAEAQQAVDLYRRRYPRDEEETDENWESDEDEDEADYEEEEIDEDEAEYDEEAAEEEIVETEPIDVEALPPVKIGPWMTAEEHLARADHLQEEQILEMALLECSLATHLQPHSADAWNLRGIILEDLERERLAQAAYRRAVELEPDFEEAQANLEDLENRLGPGVTDYYTLIGDLQDRDPRVRLEAAALLAVSHDLQALDDLIAALEDPEREVVAAAVEALGELKERRASGPLVALHERTWTMLVNRVIDLITHQVPDLATWRLSVLQDWHLRMAALQALGRIGDANALLEALRWEINAARQQDHILRQEGLPGLAAEAGLTLEVGAYALEDAGDTVALLEVVEKAASESEETEVAGMAAAALDTLARPHREAGELPVDLLKRLVALPDLRLLRLAYSFGKVRDAARFELSRRGIR